MTSAQQDDEGHTRDGGGAPRLRLRLNHAHAWLYSYSGGRFGGSVGGHGFCC